MFVINARHCAEVGLRSLICNPASQLSCRYDAQLILFLIIAQVGCPMTIRRPQPPPSAEKQWDLQPQRRQPPTENGGPSTQRMQNQCCREESRRRKIIWYRSIHSLRRPW